MSTHTHTVLLKPAKRIISSKPYNLLEYYKKLARYSFLIGVLSKRELKIKYAKTFLGIGWLFIQPLILVLVYSFFFRNIIKLDTGNVPYPSFVFSGLVLWYIFTGIVSKSSTAILESSELINKVPFPRLIIILSKTIPVLLETTALLVLLILVLLVTQQPIGFNAITAIAYLFQAVVFSLGLGMFCSVLTVKHRDLVHLVPFAMNFGIWLTPVFYPVSIVPQAYQQYLLFLNPMAGAIEGFRGALFFNAGISAASLISILISCLFLLFAFYYFVRFEKKIVDNL